MRVLLTFCALLLGGLLAIQWLGWRPVNPLADLEQEQSNETAGVPPVSPSTLGEVPDVDHYAVISDRPLFVPDRRPPSDEAAETDVPEEELPAKLEYDLTAVVMSPEGKTALLQKPGEKKVERALEGDLLDGWTLTQILEDRVVLERQGEKNTIVLRDFSEKQAAPAPKQPSPRARPQPNLRARNPMQPRERRSQEEG